MLHGNVACRALVAVRVQSKTQLGRISEELVAVTEARRKLRVSVCM
jgi:hypothetical protein